VHLAGDYLGTWYTETAAQTAEQAASAVRRRIETQERDAPPAPP
jgi:hypothetical protein